MLGRIGVRQKLMLCKECDSGEVADVWLLRCSAWNHLKQTLLEAMDDVGEDFSTRDNGDRTALILSHACRNYHILSIINSMWSVIGSSNPSVTHNLPFSVLTLVSLRMTHLCHFL